MRFLPFILFLLACMACQKADNAKSTSAANPKSNDEASSEPSKEVKPSQTSKNVKVSTPPQDVNAKADSNKGQVLLESYSNKAKGLLKDIETDPKSKSVGGTAASLVKQGVTLTEMVLAKEPECDGYLKALLAAAPKLGSMSTEEIETGYHQDGKLPASPKDICHHAKDLIVHPATVLVMNRSKGEVDVGGMKKEIVEVLAHLHHIKALFE